MPCLVLVLHAYTRWPHGFKSVYTCLRDTLLHACVYVHAFTLAHAHDTVGSGSEGCVRGSWWWSWWQCVAVCGCVWLCVAVCVAVCGCVWRWGGEGGSSLVGEWVGGWVLAISGGGCVVVGVR
jgi:hypothetical protein